MARGPNEETPPERLDEARPPRSAGTPAQELEELATRLVPGANRALILERLNELFRSGRAPDPFPDGFLHGQLVATSTTRPLDAFGRSMAQLWMPWKGKRFERARSAGMNVFAPGVLTPIRILFPRYTPESISGERVEAFPFTIRVAPGHVDSDVDVLKIDYGLHANPRLVRRILDELVELTPGVYLGKILFRTRHHHRAVGYFSLRATT